MGRRRNLGTVQASSSKRKHEANDRLVKVESRHLVKHATTDWTDVARINTSLPVLDKSGRIQQKEIDPEIPQVVNPPAEALFKPLAKPVNSSAKQSTNENYAACSPYLSAIQRQALMKLDQELNSLTLLEFLSHLESTARVIIENPTSELYKMEAIYTRMKRYRALFLNCSDLNEIEDLAKSYLIVFVAFGKLLQHVLPGYVVVDDTSSEPQRSETKRATRQYELLSLHLYSKWLLEDLSQCILTSDYLMNSRPLIEPVCVVLADALHSLKSSNLREEFLSNYIALLARTNDSNLFENLALALEQDTQLTLATIVVPAILGKSTSLGKSKKHSLGRKKGNQPNVEIGHAVIGRTLRLCDHLNVEKKENNAIAELARKGLTVKEVLSKSNTQVQLKVDKERAMGMVSGDFRKFQANKKLILEAMLQLFISVVRNPTNYTLQTLYETLRAMSKHAHLINVEMVQELSTELKRLATVVVHSKKYTGSSASIVLAAVLASIQLTKLSSKTSDLYIETDMLWIVPAVIEATSALAFTLSQNAIPTDSITTGLECSFLFDSNTELTLEDLVEVLQHVIDSRKSLGSLSESFSHLAKCAGATKLYGALSAITVLATSQSTVVALNKIRATLVKRYPTLQGVNDDEGLVLDPLDGAYSISWSQHLAKLSIFS